MQQHIDQIMAIVTSRATAEVARQKLQELAAQRESEHARRVTVTEVERELEHAQQRAATLECERVSASA